MILLLDVTGLRSPADGHLDLGPLMPTNLMSGALGGVLAFTVSAFIGFETVAVYREEAASHRAVKVACYGTIGFLAVFYALSSWALASAVGPSKIVDVARDPSANLPFSILGENFGPLMETIGQALLITGLFAALLSFHSVVARYVYALAREGVLPANLGTLGGAHGGVPIAGSIAQTSTAAIGIAIFAVAGADPIATLFTWLSELSALGILALMIFTSVAVVRYYSKQGRALGWSLGVAPVVSAVALSAILTVNIANMDSILNTEVAALRWVLPAIVVLIAALGVAVAGRIRQRRPSAYLKIGRGQPRPLAVPERVLARLEM